MRLPFIGNSSRRNRASQASRSMRRLFLEPLERRDLMATVNFDTPPGEYTEENTNLSVPFYRDNTSGSLTVNVTLSGTAVSGTDYTTVSSFNFADLEGYTTLTIPLLEDAVYDGDKFLRITIASGGYTIGSPDNIIVVIRDDESPSTTPIEPNEEVDCSCSMSSGVEFGLTPAGGSLWAGLGGGSLAYRAAYQTIPLIGVTTSFAEQAERPLKIKAVPYVEGMNLAPIWYDSSAIEWGEDHRFVARTDDTLAQGRYNWGYEITEIYAGGAERVQLFSSTSIRRTSDFPAFGNAWAPKFHDQIIVDTGGVIMAKGDGTTFWFEADGSDFITPEGDLLETVLETAGSGYIATDKHGNVTVFNSYGLPSERRDRYGNATTYDYADVDSDSHQDDLIGYTEPSGYSVEYLFTGGKLSSIVDSTGLEIAVTIDGDGNLTEYELPDPDGAGPLTAESYTFGYDVDTDLLTSFTTAAGSTTFAYADLDGDEVEDDLIGFVEPGSADKDNAPFFSYGLLDLDEIGASDSDLAPMFLTDDGYGIRTDSLGNDSKVKTDRFGNALEKIDELGRKTTITRDEDGRPLTETRPDPDGVGGESAYATTSAYDGNGNLVEFTNPDGSVEEWTYDLTLNVPTEYVDRFENVTLYDVDATYGYVLEERRVVGDVDDGINLETNDIVTTYTYMPEKILGTDSPGGLIASTVDALGVLTEFDYDQFGNLLATTYAVGTPFEASVVQEYDPVTQWLLTTIDELGRETAYTYDDFGRVVTTTLPDPDSEGPLAAPVLTNVYDEEGNLWKTIDPLGRETAYTYDARGNRTHVIRPDHDGDTNLTVTEYVFNLANQLLTLIDPLGRETAYVYADDGALLETTLPDAIDPNGLWTRDRWSRKEDNYEGYVYAESDGESLFTAAYLVTGNGYDYLRARKWVKPVKKGCAYPINELLQLTEERLRTNVVSATTRFWGRFPGIDDMTFENGESPMTAGEISAYFPGKDTDVVDCIGAARLVMAKALVDTLLPGEFDNLYRLNTIPYESRKDELTKKGDRGYIQNDLRYLEKHGRGAGYQGENVIYLGGGQFWGWPDGNKTFNEWKQFLIKQYNDGLDPSEHISTIPGYLESSHGFLDVAQISEQAFDLRKSTLPSGGGEER